MMSLIERCHPRQGDQLVLVLNCYRGFDIRFDMLVKEEISDT